MKKLISLDWKSLFRIHLPISVGLALLSLLFYYPLLSGKVLVQSDIRQYEGMSRQLKEHRVETGQETYWIDNAFGDAHISVGGGIPRRFFISDLSFF